MLSNYNYFIFTDFRTQIEVYNYIGTNITTLQAVKSLPIGKMVLCQFDDGQWYRACIVKTLKG